MAIAKTRQTSKKQLTPKQVGLRYGFRSGLEEKIAEQIESEGHSVRFESQVITYVKPAKAARYTPDFHLDNGIIIESKGRFLTADRQKHLLVKQQHPDLDIRFVFSNSKQKISKQSTTTYAAWCEKHGFVYADKFIPTEWFKEKRKKAA